MDPNAVDLEALARGQILLGTHIYKFTNISRLGVVLAPPQVHKSPTHIVPWATPLASSKTAPSLPHWCIIKSCG